MYTILLELIPITAAAGGGASPCQPHPPQPAGIAILSKLSNNRH
jgi:hypothetical protein